MRRIFELAATLLAMSSTSALAQVTTDCKGDYPRPMTDGQYHFLLNTRMEKFSDYAMVYTCVANKVQGYFRLRWHIPGHYFESNVPEANELPRPVGIGDAIALRNGCY